jgi:hypothetical protein
LRASLLLTMDAVSVLLESALLTEGSDSAHISSTEGGCDAQQPGKEIIAQT